MSHGKKAILKGKTKNMIKLGERSFDFSDEEALGYVPTHGLVGGDPSKAKREIVRGINDAIAKKFRELRLPGNAPTVTENDVNFTVHTKK